MGIGNAQGFLHDCDFNFTVALRSALPCAFLNPPPSTSLFSNKANMAGVSNPSSSSLLVYLKKVNVMEHYWIRLNKRRVLNHSFEELGRGYYFLQHS